MNPPISTDEALLSGPYTKGSRKNNLAFCCGSHAQLNHNRQAAMVCWAWEPQPCGARRRAGICGVAAPRRYHHIACVAAPCICLPGARAKMPNYSCANPEGKKEGGVKFRPGVAKQYRYN